jgi:hypothetical protein
MNEAPDPLEALLSDLRPHEVSPGLRQRIAERLDDSPPLQKKRRWLWRIALAGGLAAACLAAVLFRRGSDPLVKPQPVAVLPQPAPPVMFVDSGFTLLAYERALARSPEDLDALLAKDAVVAPESNPELVGICAFTRSDVAIHALLGDD